MLSDDELVEQILLGNENAAEELIKRYYTSILRYCRWHCSNLEKAEDLTQETFLKLFKNLSGYKGKKKFKAYLYTIANHLCIDETALSKGELYTILTNRDKHGRKGTIVAIVKGTKAEDVINVLLKIDADKRNQERKLHLIWPAVCRK